MSEPRGIYVTDGARAFLRAFVQSTNVPLAAAMEWDAWRRAAMTAGQQEKAHLTAAEHWREERLECEERAAAIVEKYPELANESL